jgi:hypothetical protein
MLVEETGRKKIIGIFDGDVKTYLTRTKNA